MVNDDTIHSDVFELVYDRLDGKSSWSSSETPTVTGSYIDGGEEFPQIVIDPAMVNQDPLVFDKTSLREKTVNVVVHIYTSNTYNGSANKDRDLLSNDVTNELLNERLDRLSFQSMSESQDDLELGGVKVRLKSLSFTFRKV